MGVYLCMLWLQNRIVNLSSFIVNLNYCSLFVTFYITLALSWDYCASTCHYLEIKNILVVDFTNETLLKFRPIVGASWDSEPWTLNPPLDCLCCSCSCEAFCLWCRVSDVWQPVLFVLASRWMCWNFFPDAVFVSFWAAGWFLYSFCWLSSAECIMVGTILLGFCTPCASFAVYASCYWLWQNCVWFL